MIKCERCEKVHKPYRNDLEDWIQDHKNEIHYDIEQSARTALAKEDGWKNIDDLFFCHECAEELGNNIIDWIWQEETVEC